MWDHDELRYKTARFYVFSIIAKWISVGDIRPALIRFSLAHRSTPLRLENLRKIGHFIDDSQII